MLLIKACYRSVFLCFAILLLLPSAAKLQPYLGTKTPYAAPVKMPDTKPPMGYQPVFINYTGRHGSRFMTKAGSDVDVLAVLDYAEKNAGLTKVGKRIKGMAERFLEIEKDNYESITLLGAAEQEAIGKRFFTLYPTAFPGKGIDVIMTHKVRTQQSAAAFTKGLQGYAGKRNEKINPETEDNTLRFYDIAPAYAAFKKSGPLKNKMDSLEKDPRTLAVAKSVCERIFTTAFAKTLFIEGVATDGKKNNRIDGKTFTDDLYDLYTISFSMSIEMKQKGFSPADIDFGIAFQKPDLQWLDLVNGAADFYEKGPGLDTLGLQIKIAAPLLADYMNTTQDFISGKQNKDGIFRFTHAEAISPFATLLGIRQASKPSAGVFTYTESWQANAIIPLSANICWIVYSNGKDHLIKVLLNEREARLPIPTQTFPYYKWDALRAYYERKLQVIGTDCQQDMHAYLLNLR